MANSKIVGIGSYLPKEKLNSVDLAEQLGVDENWIVSRSGIHQRSISAENEFSSDHGYTAALQALESAGITAQDLDLIIFSTSSPDRLFPSCSCIIQERLGNTSCPAFDLNATCSGFIYGLTIADKFIKQGGYKNILVVGAETPTRYNRLDHPEIIILFGDGGGAAVVAASEEEGIIDTSIGANGKYGPVLESNKIEEALHKGQFAMNMDGQTLFKQATKTMAIEIKNILQRNNLTIDDIDWLVPHQANERILQTTLKLARFPAEKAIVTVGEHANTSSATIPLALHAAMKDGRIKSGDLCLFVAFGAGFVYGSLLIRI